MVPPSQTYITLVITQGVTTGLSSSYPQYPYDDHVRTVSCFRPVVTCTLKITSSSRYVPERTCSLYYSHYICVC